MVLAVIIAATTLAAHKKPTPKNQLQTRKTAAAVKIIKNNYNNYINKNTANDYLIIVIILIWIGGVAAIVSGKITHITCVCTS